MNPINIISLDDLVFFLDKRLSKYNVYQVTVVTPFIDEVITDIVTFMQRYTCNQLLQELGIDYAKFTFVSHVNCNFFHQYLLSVCQQVAAIHKLPLFNII